MHFRLLALLTILVSSFSFETQAAKYRYVSIDSGGMLGLIPAHLLASLEQKAGKPMHQLVDGFIGTSTGAIISSLLTINAPESEAPYQTADVINFYKEKGAPIFEAALNAAVTNQIAKYLGGEMDYSAGALLKEHTKIALGERKLVDAKTRLIILTHNMSVRQTQYFDNRGAGADLTVSDVVRASASVADVFGPTEIQMNDKKHKYVDAGSMGVRDPISDPTQTLISILEGELAADDECVIYSLGTGFADGRRLDIKHPGIKVIRIEPDMKNFMEGRYSSFIGKNLLAAQTSQDVTDAMVQAAETLKESQEYKNMLGDLNLESNKTEL